MAALVVVARTQDLLDCDVDAGSPLTVSNTEEAAMLATRLNCSNGDFAVRWLGNVIVPETIRVASGTSLNITGAGPDATAEGRNTTQLFYVDDGSRLHLSDMTLTHGGASHGGAIRAQQSSVSFSGNVSFISNSASDLGGAIYAYGSSVSWDGDGVQFHYNSADGSGGAIFATTSDVSWEGAGAEFSSNFAGLHGGAICAVVSSSVSWKGDNVRFSYNTVDGSGSAIFTRNSNVSWYGDDTNFSENKAEKHGGSIYATGVSKLSWDGPTTFSGNLAGGDGGALALVDFGEEEAHFFQATFNENTAGNGGAIYVYNSVNGFNLTDVVFKSNSAGNAGGAFAAYAGTEDLPATFSSCHFLDNTANDTGGAVETLSGQQTFVSCGFEGNAAGKGQPAVFSIQSNDSADECFHSPKHRPRRPVSWPSAPQDTCISLGMNQSPSHRTTRCRRSFETGRCGGCSRVLLSLQHRFIPGGRR